MKLPDDIDDGDKLLLLAVIIDALGNPDEGEDADVPEEFRIGRKKSLWLPFIYGCGFCCVVVFLALFAGFVVGLNAILFPDSFSRS